MTSKKVYKAKPKATKTVKHKVHVIEEVLKSDDDKTFSMTVLEFKQLFSSPQLLRGWTKPQIELILEKINNG